MLTNSCVKLQTVHTIPVTMNKEGKSGKTLLSFNSKCIFSYSLVLHLERCSLQKMNRPACTAS